LIIGPVEIRFLSNKERLLARFKSVGPREDRHSPMRSLSEMLGWAFENGYQENHHTYDEVQEYLFGLINRDCPNANCKVCNPE